MNSIQWSVVRGVEIRHDAPKFIKELQTELLSALFDCENVEEIINKGYENALLLVTQAMDKIMIGGEDIAQDDLVIHKLLGQDIRKYKSLFHHVSAAIQLSNNEDKLPSKGDMEVAARTETRKREWYQNRGYLTPNWFSY